MQKANILNIKFEKTIYKFFYRKGYFMKTMKRVLALLIALLMVCMMFTAVACGGKNDNNDNNENAENGGTENGGTQNGGNNNVTPKSNLETFMDAKSATYASGAFKYTYTMGAQLKFKGAISFSAANTNGEICYNKNAGNTVYVHKKENSGALLFDSTKYIYNNGTDLIEISADETKDFSVVNSSKITADYDFETNALGNLVKGLTEDNISEITKSGSTYNITLKTSFTNKYLSILNFIDSEKIIDTITKYTSDAVGVTPTFVCTATLSPDATTLKSFALTANISIKDTVDIIFSYSQTFVSVGENIPISIPSFGNTLIDSTAINSELNDVVSAINEVLNAPSSYYTYKLETEVDHGVSKGNPLGLAVNSTSTGFAQRQIIGNDIFFHNRLALDSDYKNNDQYPDIVVDYERYRARVNNTTKDVYDVTDGAFKNTYTQLENYDNADIDNYYMMIDLDWLSSDSVKIMRVTENQDGTTKYELGLSNDAVKSILLYYNDQIRLDADLEEHIDVYKIASAFSANKATFEIVLDVDGNVASIEIDTNGFYTLSDGEQVKFELKLNIEFNYTKAPYTAPTEYGDITLTNS